MSHALRRALVLAIGALLSLATYVAVTESGGSGRAGAATTMLVHVKQGSLDQSCGDQSIIGAHFVINQISEPPDTINVVLSDNSSVVVPLSKQTRSVGQYTTMFSAGLTVTDATASVPTSWTGQFVLSNYICGTGPSSPPPSSPPPSSGPPPTGTPAPSSHS
jgi:hypothetical protein